MPDYTSLIDKHFKYAGLTRAMVVTLRDVRREEVGQDKEILPVAYFSEDPRGLVLNSGRYKILAAAHGSADTDNWIGCQIELSPDPTVKFKGKVTGGVAMKVTTLAPKKN